MAQNKKEMGNNSQESTPLQVTSCQVFPFATKEGKTLALAKIVINDQLQLTSLRVIDGCGGLFVAYPNDPHSEDTYRSLFFPSSKNLREDIEDVVLKAYRDAIKKK